MAEDADKPVDVNLIRAMLDRKQEKMKLCLRACAGCTLCADSCFLFRSHDQDPHYMPSYKVLNTLGQLYKKKGKVTREQLEQMQELVSKHCALCGRCYCPIGIDLPSMVAFVRSILRSQGLYGIYPYYSGAPEGAAPSAVTEQPSQPAAETGQKDA